MGAMECAPFGKRCFVRPGDSGWSGQFCRDQDFQNCGGVTNASRDGHERFRYKGMLLRQFRKAFADVMEPLNFEQDGVNRHEWLRWE